MPTGFKQVMPFLLASLVYHKSWLESKLCSNHPLFTTFLWTSGQINEYLAHVRTGIYQCDDTGMKATGIPPHIAIMYEILTINRALANVQHTVTDRSQFVVNILNGM
jgi:hypothetical protein